jgi:transcriptional repressor NrdR
MQLESLVSNVEQDLYTCGSNEIPSVQIGEQVMERLAGINEVAYVRFASVYRRFKDITGFEQELTQIKNKKSPTR